MRQNKFVPITCLAGGSDDKMFTAIINQGIDSHLEAFTKSNFRYETKKISEKLTLTRLCLDFEVSELAILVRRLDEMAYNETGELVNESALTWSQDIQDLEEFSK